MMGDISSAGRGDKDVSPADRLRASHEYRDRVIELLRVAAGDGRLTAEELDERVEGAFSADVRRACRADQRPAGGRPGDRAGATEHASTGQGRRAARMPERARPQGRPGGGAPA